MRSNSKANKRKRRRSGKKKRGPKMAETADRHQLYQDSVQTPEADIEFFTKVYREHNGRDPLVLREDFCGTAYLSTEWCKSDPERSAVGVDLDQPTLDWGIEHNLEPAGAEVAERVHLVKANVLDVTEPLADVTCAMNFSYCVFKTRAELRRYFEVVRRGLGPGGMFACELYGGTEAVVEIEDEREVDDLTYIWDQDKYNPITHDTLCYIHFEFPDGSKLERAFTYDWRLWTIPELREVMLEAGFADVQVWWEDVDDDGDGTGEYHPTVEEENQEAWLVYLVATQA